MSVPEIDLTDPDLLKDPFASYGKIREQAPIARIPMPGIGSVWAVLRHQDARAMLSDPRFAITNGSFMRPPGIPEHCVPYLRTMSERDGAEHARLRKLATPAFTARKAAALRPRIAAIVDQLLDDVAEQTDLLDSFAKQLPMEVICELVGIPEQDRPLWRTAGAAMASGSPSGFADAVPHIVDGATDALARRKTEPGDDVLSDLLRAHEGDRLDDTEMITLVWHLVLAGQTPTNFIANAVDALLAHPGQLAMLRDDPAKLSVAVDELIRWCGPALLSIPRYAAEEIELCGAVIGKGEAVSAVVASVNRDPRVFAEPETLNLRALRQPGHLGFGHGPHYCLGASLARVESEVAIEALLRRFPGLSRDGEAQRAPDPGTWRLMSLPLSLNGSRGNATESGGPGVAAGLPAG